MFDKMSAIPNAHSWMGMGQLNMVPSAAHPWGGKQSCKGVPTTRPSPCFLCFISW